jgi:hypothetical protein
MVKPRRTSVALAGVWGEIAIQNLPNAKVFNGILRDPIE